MIRSSQFFALIIETLSVPFDSKHHPIGSSQSLCIDKVNSEPSFVAYTSKHLCSVCTQHKLCTWSALNTNFVLGLHTTQTLFIYYLIVAQHKIKKTFFVIICGDHVHCLRWDILYTLGIHEIFLHKSNLHDLHRSCSLFELGYFIYTLGIHEIFLHKSNLHNFHRVITHSVILIMVHCHTERKLYLS